MKGNPAVPGGLLTSKPTWSNTLRCSTASAFFSHRTVALTRDEPYLYLTATESSDLCSLAARLTRKAERNRQPRCGPSGFAFSAKTLPLARPPSADRCLEPESASCTLAPHCNRVRPRLFRVCSIGFNGIRMTATLGSAWTPFAVLCYGAGSGGTLSSPMTQMTWSNRFSE